MNKIAKLHNDNLVNWEHFSDIDLERYYLGMVKGKTALARLEEHALACPSCAGRAEEAQDYVDAIRVASILFSEKARYMGRVVRERVRSRR